MTEVTNGIDCTAGKNPADVIDSMPERRWPNYAARGWIEKVNEINEKYSKPRLKMTPLVRAALLALRLYLIMLVIILIYKFYTMIR